MVEVIRCRNEWLENLASRKCRVVSLGGRKYTIHPFQATLPMIPGIYDAILEEVDKMKIRWGSIDKIFALAAKAIPMATMISYTKRIPLVVAYGREYDLVQKDLAEKKIKIIEEKMYAEKLRLFSYGLKKGDKVLLVDDDVNWGHASIGTLKALWEKDIDVVDIVIGAEKVGRNGIKSLAEYINKSGIKNPPRIIVISSLRLKGYKLLPALKEVVSETI